MTPLPKHLEEMRDELAETHAGKRYEKLLGSYVSQSWQASVVDHNVGFQNCYHLMLKDLESMAQALELYANKEIYEIDAHKNIVEHYACETHWIGTAAREELKNYREKYGDKNGR